MIEADHRNDEKLSSAPTPEQLCSFEMTGKHIQDLVGFLRQKYRHDGRVANEAYRTFVTDIPEEDLGKRIDTSFLSTLADRGVVQHRETRSFDHFRFFYDDKKTNQEVISQIYGRLYFCPQADKVASLADKLIRAHVEQRKDLIGKMAKSANRNDRIIIYLTEDFAEEIKLIRTVQKQFPDLFAHAGKNKLWCDIAGLQNVYFGGEAPSHARSYSEDRVGVIEDIMVVQDKGLVSVDNDRQLQEIYQLACLKRDVNPFNWGFYLEPKKGDMISISAEYVLFCYMGEGGADFAADPFFQDEKQAVTNWLQNHQP